MHFFPYRFSAKKLAGPHFLQSSRTKRFFETRSHFGRSVCKSFLHLLPALFHATQIIFFKHSIFFGPFETCLLVGGLLAKYLTLSAFASSRTFAPGFFK